VCFASTPVLIMCLQSICVSNTQQLRGVHAHCAPESQSPSVFAHLVVRSRTGELGIVHGAQRFVSTHLCFSKAERETLTGLASKVGSSRVSKSFPSHVGINTKRAAGADSQ
jgi:hypothetical protein